MRLTTLQLVDSLSLEAEPRSLLTALALSTGLIAVLQVWLQSVFLFALVWSVGGNTDDEGRKVFDRILRKMLVNDAPPELKPYVMVSPTVCPASMHRSSTWEVNHAMLLTGILCA